MRTIKVFLASSEELKNERLEFSDLVLQLNDLFEKRDIQLKLVKWEHLDSSMGVKHKQEEYNDKLKECELCLTLYWTKFGDYTTEEFETAYNELKEGRNPRKLYVFFKDAKDVTPELQQFKDSFASEYGHFFCKFENVDTMRLQFLLQLEAYQNHTAKKLLKVENQKVLIGGKPIVDLNNVPFAAMNDRFVELQDAIIELDEDIMELQKDSANAPNNEKLRTKLSKKLGKREKLVKQLKQHQENLFEMARKTSQLSTQRISVRSAEAIRLFNEGKASEANGILSTENLKRDSQDGFDDYDHHTKCAEEAMVRIEMLLNDWQLKTSSAIADEKLPAKKRIEEAYNAHEQVLIHAKKLNYNEADKAKYASLVFDFAYFAQKYNLFSDAIKLYEDALEIREFLAANKPNVYLPGVAMALNNLGVLYSDTNRYNQAEMSYLRALEVYESLAAKKPNVYLPDVAMTLNNWGVLYKATNRYNQAEANFLKALEVYESSAAKEPNIYLHYVAGTLNNLGALYKATNRYSQAKSSYLRALDVGESLIVKESNIHLYDVAYTLNDLGLLYSDINQYDKAESSHIRALDIYESLAVKEPNVYLSKVADLLNNLGLIYSDTNRYDKAESSHIRALDIYESLAVKEPNVYLSGIADLLT